MRMLFEIDKKDYDGETKTFYRPSARAIIRKDGKIALVYSQKYNYYKFPGGGIKKGESREDALMREVNEEVGLIVTPQSIKEYGRVLRTQKDARGGIYKQDNYYYLCSVYDETCDQNLDPYEEFENFELRFVTPKEAIETNRNCDHGPKDLTMIERESKVLECIMNDGLI